MLVKSFKQALVGSSLLLGMALPVFAAPAINDYPVVIHFSNTNDAKLMVQSAYTTLVEMNATLDLLNQYTIKALSSGVFFDDELFQRKKYNLVKNLNHHKLKLSIFGNESLYIDVKGEKETFIYIPSMQFSELGLNDTDLVSVEHAKQAEQVLKTAHKTLRDLIAPISGHESNANRPDSAVVEGMNALYIKDARAFTTITNALEQVFGRYLREVSALQSLAARAATGKLSPSKLEKMNRNYQEMLHKLSWHFDGGDKSVLMSIFKDNQLTLNTAGDQKKTYYFPDLTLSILQLKNDSIDEFVTSVFTYYDIYTAMSWILNWNISGKDAFIPFNHTGSEPLVPAFLSKK